MSEDKTQHMPDARSFEERVFARFDALDSRLDGMDARIESVEARLTALEEKVDRRLQETRPIWEQVLVRLDAVEAGLSETRAEIKAGLRRVERQIDILNHNILDVRTDVDELDERVTKLESEPAQ
jgi:chromosome segregation ATPase